MESEIEKIIHEASAFFYNKAVIRTAADGEIVTISDDGCYVKRTKQSIAFYTADARMHRVNDPAYISYSLSKDGKVSTHYLSWWKYGVRHRDDGPAVVSFDSLGGTRYSWFKNNRQYIPSAHDKMLWKLKSKI